MSFQAPALADGMADSEELHLRSQMTGFDCSGREKAELSIQRSAKIPL